jgi:S-adenosylmethionine:tRNA ribosyltransferase-isomerase
MIQHAQVLSNRIIAIGTTVVRALEDTASMFEGAVPSGERLATQRLGATSRLRIVNTILSGTHARGTSHYELLRAFVDDKMLGRIDQELNARGYRTHEFGDSVFIERADNRMHYVEQPDGGDRLSHGEISPVLKKGSDRSSLRCSHGH